MIYSNKGEFVVKPELIIKLPSFFNNSNKGEFVVKPEHTNTSLELQANSNKGEFVVKPEQLVLNAFTAKNIF